jgi:dimethylaniline monooxygenase (N-oxide forming)
MLRVGSLASRASRRHDVVARSLSSFTSSSSSASDDGDIKWQFLVPPSPKQRLLMGCVSYDPAVGQIWDGIKEWLTSSSGGNLPHFDYVLFTNYEQQVSALLDGQIDVAWNGPVAHVMAEDLAADRPDIALVESVGMRDVDRDFKSVALIKRDCLQGGGGASSSAGVSAMKGQTIATGSTDSPQGHLVPVDWLIHTVGVEDANIIPYNIDLGKHGDTAIGEIEAMKAMLDGSGGTSAALVSEMMYQRGLNGAIDAINAEELRESVVQIRDSPPVFDHCSFDALVGDHPSDGGKSSDIDSHRAKIGAFSNAILSMDMNDPCQAPIMKLEGINRQWMGPRVDPGGAVRTALHRRGLASAGRSNNFGSQMRAFSSSSASFERVAVLGAGVSGLQSVRALKAKGFDVTAYDGSPNVGGLWRKNYLSYGVQVPKQLYEFPDLEFSEVEVGKYPSGAEVQKYIERYVDHFNLGDNIALNTSVTKVTQNQDGSWSVKIKTNDGKEEDNHFDKVVVATGLYSNKNPSLPAWATGETAACFNGEILHSSQVHNAEQIEGKKVVVVGNGKSAVDLAVASSNAGADSVTLLSRNPHWPTPRLIADIIPFQYVFLSRTGQNLVLGLTGPLPGCSPSHSSLWHSVGQFIMPPIFKVVELLFAAQFRNVTGPTSPFNKVGVVEDFYGYAQVLDYSLRDKVKSGEVDWKVGAIDSFESDGVVLADGEKVEANMIICGTGFQKDYSIFDNATREKLNIEFDGLWLFNHTVPTNVDNLAFVGSELAVISNITGYGLQAAWLSKLWSGEIDANKQDMESEVNELKEWKRKWMPNTPSRSSLVLLHQIHWYDRIMRDMGLKVGRKSNILSEWFMPYESSDYHGVLTTLAVPFK